MNLPTCISSNRKIRYTVCFVVLVALLVIFFTISVCAGSVQIPLSDIWRQFRGEQDELYAAILFQIRIRERLRQSCSVVRWHCPGICCRLFFIIRSQDRLSLAFLPGQNYLWRS